ncbi:DUF6090 family protein [Winogradskyella maritima]|uniref:DUF6090 family protein n=1 Tax=Winogradskyella maritima TaxID=1517766 RepID=A0ABV8AGJ9_9FLAO|nr:DUF6090 family protein [Winogradskyella maritima]
MIKFFRQIRLKSMENNKTSRYLKYAIGEIILVVIGILIALQINNWNSERQRQRNINAVLKEIQTDLQKNILKASELFDGYIGKDSLYQMVNNNKLTKEDYMYNKGDLYGVYFAYWYATYEISDNAYLKYKGLIGDNSSANDTLTNMLDNMFVPLKTNIEVFEKRLQNTVYENIDYLAKNKDWYYKWNASSPSLLDTDYLEFYLKDEFYKNQVAVYINDYLNLVRDAQTFRIQALQVSQLIANRLGESDNLYKDQVFTQETFANDLIGDYTLQKPELSTKEDKQLQVTYKNQQVFISNGNKEIPLYPHSNSLYYGSNLQQVFKFISNNDSKSPTLIIINESGHHEYHKSIN